MHFDCLAHFLRHEKTLAITTLARAGTNEKLRRQMRQGVVDDVYLRLGSMCEFIRLTRYANDWEPVSMVNC